MRHALLVDPNRDRLALLRRELGDGVDVTDCTTFQAARDCLLRTTAPLILVSNLRLGPFNGLHLVYLAAYRRPDARCLVYDEPTDPQLAFEAQLIGAFYETTSRLQFTLPVYIHAQLPERDRRDVRHLERRTLFRGGRRAADVIVSQPVECGTPHTGTS